MFDLFCIFYFFSPTHVLLCPDWALDFIVVSKLRRFAEVGDVLFCQLHWEVWSEGVDDTVESWSHGAIESWSHGVMESWSHGVMESWNHGVMESWSHGAMESRSHGEVKQVAAKLHSCQQPLGSTVLLSLFGETQRCHWCRGLFVGGTPCQFKKLRKLTLPCKGPNSKHGIMHIHIQCFLSTMRPLFQKCVVTWGENVAFAALSLAVRTTLSNFKSQFISDYVRRHLRKILHELSKGIRRTIWWKTKDWNRHTIPLNKNWAK
jgi:hypothetical protein